MLATAILLSWYLATNSGMVDDLFLPSPGQFWLALKKLFLYRDFHEDILISVSRVLIAWGISFLVAIPIALLLSKSETLYKVLSPYIDFLRYLPVPVLIPLIILFMGIGESAKISLLFIGTVFQLLLLVYDDLKDIPSEYFDISFTLNFSKWEKVKMELNAIGPSLWNNCRITMGWCWTYLVIAELVASQEGIGYMVKEAQRFSNTPEIYVGIVTMGFIGLASDLSWKVFYPVVFKYKRTDS
jgi:NitT/TauT family transport system permease protein